MKTIKLFIVLLTFAFALNASAQSKETITIKTSAECDMCEKKIEKFVALEKGVKKADMNLATKEITVTYNPKKTNPEAIKKAINSIGYDADDMPANNKAYKKLEKCCQKPETENK